jgi:hypothetical protein
MGWENQWFNTANTKVSIWMLSFTVLYFAFWENIFLRSFLIILSYLYRDSPPGCFPDTLSNLFFPCIYFSHTSYMPSPSVLESSTLTIWNTFYKWQCPSPRYIYVTRDCLRMSTYITLCQNQFPCSIVSLPLVSLTGTGIAQWYIARLQPGWLEVRVLAGARNFSLHHRVQTGSGEPTQPPIQCVPGTPSLGVKRPSREADHSPSSSAEVKNALSYASIPPVRLHDVALI